MPSDPFKDLTTSRKKGATVFLEGDLGSEMYIVQSGAVRIFRELNGVKQELAVMEKGDFFGELSVLEGLPRTTSAEVIQDADLLEINTTTFDKMIRANIEIAVRMLRKLSTRLQEANRKLEAVSRGGPAGKRSKADVEAVDIDRPADASPDAPPSIGVATPPKPLSEIEVPPGVLGLLILDGGSRQFPILTEAAVIGRYDPVTGTRPEIDLTQVDIHRSVSRRHARILAEGGTFRLAEEVGALNGTSINGQRLTPGQPKPIVNGDRLGLGMVSLVFKAGEVRASEKGAPARSSTSRRG